MNDVVYGPPAKLQLMNKLHGCMGQTVVRIHNKRESEGATTMVNHGRRRGAIVSMDGGPYILMVQNRFT